MGSLLFRPQGYVKGIRWPGAHAIQAFFLRHDVKAVIFTVDARISGKSTH